MIWIEKYRPKSFDEMIGKRETVRMLSSYNLETIPHLIMHGQSGHGKKTVLLGLVRHLYGDIPSTRLRNAEIQSGSKRLSVSYLESDEYIEVCPSDYGYQDKAVIQGIIKEMGQTRPILSMFDKHKRRSIKLIVITCAEELSYEAQAALRRTIEMYSKCFRIILICDELSRLIEPIRSRCVFVRVPGFSDQDVMENMSAIIKKENYTVPSEVLYEICEHSAGNMRRALCTLELFCFNQNGGGAKRMKMENKTRLDWECLVDSIVSVIKSEQSSMALYNIRKDLYLLMSSCISPRTILIELLRGLILGVDFKSLLLLSRHALTYEERMRLGTKSVYHLEGFIAASMCVLSERKYGR